VRHSNGGPFDSPNPRFSVPCSNAPPQNEGWLARVAPLEIEGSAFIIGGVYVAAADNVTSPRSHLSTANSSSISKALAQFSHERERRKALQSIKERLNLLLDS
jgi:hypothetical protein